MGAYVGAAVAAGVGVGVFVGVDVGMMSGVGTFANVADVIEGVEVAVEDLFGIGVGVGVVPGRGDGVGVEIETMVGESLWNSERQLSRHCWLMSGRIALTSKYRKTMTARSFASLFIASS